MVNLHKRNITELLKGVYDSSLSSHSVTHMVAASRFCSSTQEMRQWGLETVGLANFGGTSDVSRTCLGFE